MLGAFMALTSVNEDAASEMLLVNERLSFHQEPIQAVGPELAHIVVYRFSGNRTPGLIV